MSNIRQQRVQVQELGGGGGNHRSLQSISELSFIDLLLRDLTIAKNLGIQELTGEGQKHGGNNWNLKGAVCKIQLISGKTDFAL